MSYKRSKVLFFGVLFLTVMGVKAFRLCPNCCFLSAEDCTRCPKCDYEDLMPALLEKMGGDKDSYPRLVQYLYAVVTHAQAIDCSIRFAYQKELRCILSVVSYEGAAQGILFNRRAIDEYFDRFFSKKPEISSDISEAVTRAVRTKTDIEELLNKIQELGWMFYIQRQDDPPVIDICPNADL